MMSSPELAYLLRMFPQISETFIANEVLRLEEVGLPLRLFSYRRPREQVNHECVRRVQTPIEYLVDPLWRHPLKLIQANWAVYRHDSARYRRTVRYVVGHSLRRRKLNDFQRLLQAAYLARLVKAGGVRHLHAHFARGATEVAALVSMLTGIPFSLTAHAGDIYTAKPDDLREKISAAQFVATCTQANQVYLQGLLDEEERYKIRLSYHGVDLQKFNFGAAGRADQPPVVLAAGRLVEKKGLHYLLEACGILKESGHDFRCLILGEGPERGRLESIVKMLGLESRVDLPGSCSQEELLILYKQASVFVLPCTVVDNGDRDGIPNVILEAMAVGLPVITTPVSGVPEVIRDGHNGLLSPERDSKALASAIARVLNDPALSEELRSNAVSTVVEKFDSKKNIKLLASLFRDVSIREHSRAEMTVAQGV
jgi:glycosyltransferase involved in cell wall biosynthesis